VVRFRVAAIQMQSTPDRESNLGKAEALLREAADGRAELAALPENFSFLRSEGGPFPDPEPYAAGGDDGAGGGEGSLTRWLRRQARSLGLWILGGTVAEMLPPDRADGRVYNTSMLLDPEGKVIARYRKLHLFDVAIAGGPELRESKTVAPGEAPVLAETPFGPAGLSVCYDLRFPELYRALAFGGARILFVPSAFTAHTGKDHWEPLLRARAIENQCYVIAPAQVGRHAPKRTSHGHAMIVDPWGTILAQAPDRPAVIFADLDSDQLEKIRRGLPALQHVRKDLFRP
jgi:predicted amidohydrolase